MMFFVDEDIRKARTLPSEFYTEAGFFDASREKIFAKSWQFVGPVAGDTVLTPVTLLPGMLDEPVLIVKSGLQRRCISNVCTHRGKVLVEKECNAELIRCSYHGRRFNLEGKFLSMPEFGDVADFPGPEDDLRATALEEFGGFLFASLNPFAALGEMIGPAAVAFRTGRSDLTLTEMRTYTVDAHWALYCENYLEGFHIPFVHKGLNEAVDYGSYSTQTFRYSSTQTALDDAGGHAATYVFIFPNMMFNFYPWGISVNVVRPLSVRRTEVDYFTFVSNADMLGRGAGADLHAVELEDQAVVESVQRGIGSRAYRQGRYSPAREQGTHHFHRLIAEFMNQ